jgi:DNA polymerase (family 10)
MTNEQLAGELKTLADLLIIAGCEETHASRYARLAYTISRLPEPAETLCQEGRLHEISGVGPAVARMIAEYLTTGTCAKRRAFEQQVPRTVLDIVAIPGLGAKTARRLYLELGIENLRALHQALDAGRIVRLKGISMKTEATIRRYFASQQAQTLCLAL